MLKLIDAHTTAIACLAFNNTGTRLATASEKVSLAENPGYIHARQGTVLRVFSTPDGHKLYELRRDVSSYAMITAMSFSVHRVSSARLIHGSLAGFEASFCLFQQINNTYLQA